VPDEELNELIDKMVERELCLRICLADMVLTTVSIIFRNHLKICPSCQFTFNEKLVVRAKQEGDSMKDSEDVEDEADVHDDVIDHLVNFYFARQAVDSLLLGENYAQELFAEDCQTLLQDAYLAIAKNRRWFEALVGHIKDRGDTPDPTIPDHT